MKVLRKVKSTLYSIKAFVSINLFGKGGKVFSETCDKKAKCCKLAKKVMHYMSGVFNCVFWPTLLKNIFLTAKKTNKQTNKNLTLSLRQSHRTVPHPISHSCAYRFLRQTFFFPWPSDIWLWIYRDASLRVLTWIQVFISCFMCKSMENCNFSVLNSNDRHLWT